MIKRKKTKKKIAILGDFLSSLGGTEMYNVQLAILLKEDGYDVKFFIGERPKRKEWLELLKKNRIHFYVNPFPQLKIKDRLSEQLYVILIRILFIFWKPNLLFTHPAGKMILSYLVQTQASTPIVATEWTTPGEMTKHWYQKDLKERINEIDTFIATCNTSKKGLHNYLGYNGMIKVIPHLISSPNHFDFKIENKFSLGCISRFSVEKGLDYLIAAMSFIIRKYPQATLHLYGHGIDEKRMKDQITCFGLEKNIFLEGTYLPLVGIDRIAERHCIFIQPSLFESIPTTIIELAARKRVIVATNVGGIPEILSSYPTSLLCEPGDSQQLARNVTQLLNDNNLLSDLSDKSFRAYSEKYDIHKNYAQIKDIFEKIFSN